MAGRASFPVGNLPCRESIKPGLCLVEFLMDQKLLKSLEDIADYRVGEIELPSQAQIEQWVKQFDKNVST